MKKIVHISLTPLAGAPIRIVDALNKYTNYKARLINYNPQCYGKRTFPEDLTWQKDKNECIELIKNADIIHFHHFIELNNNVFGINFKDIVKNDCKFVYHYHSNKSFVSCNQVMNVENEYTNIVVAHCAERTFLDFVPFANIIPIHDEILIPKETNNKKVKVVFSTSSKNSMYDDRWETKGYKEVHFKLKKLSKKLNFDYELIENIPYDEAMKIKQNADIIIGDIVTGSYHLTELEGLSQGKCVLTKLDPRTVLNCVSVLKCDEIPFVNTNLTTLESVLRKLIENSSLRKEISQYSRFWIEKYYDDKILVQNFVDLYERVLKGENIKRQNFDKFQNAKKYLNNEVFDIEFNLKRKKINKKGKYNIKMKAILQNIFSIKNDKRNGIKRKIIKILGIKFSFKIKNISENESKNNKVVNYIKDDPVVIGANIPEGSYVGKYATIGDCFFYGKVKVGRYTTIAATAIISIFLLYICSIKICNNFRNIANLSFIKILSENMLTFNYKNHKGEK